MEGTIKIEGYKIHCVIGSNSHEREEEQEVEVDVEIRVNILECVQTDSIADTINYQEVANVCLDLAKHRKYHLLETFAYEAIHAIMNAFSPIWVKIAVKKKYALPLARGAVVELELAK